MLELVLIPKSMTFMLERSFFFFNSMFSGFKSLCRILNLWQQFMADKIYQKITAAFSSLRNYFFTIQSKSSPPSQSSLQIQKLSLSKKYSYIFKIFGWSSFLMHSTSLIKSSICSVECHFFFIIFMARNYRVYMCRAFFTSPYDPLIKEST